MGRRFNGMFICLGLLLAATSVEEAYGKGVSVDEATASQKEAAQKLFVEGMQRIEQKNFAQALESFQASYETVASPNSHLMIARALRELDRPVEAYEHFQGVIAEVQADPGSKKKYASAEESARKELEELKARIAFISLRVKGATADTKLQVGGREIPQEQWDQDVPVRAGVVVISASAPGKADVRLEVGATGGQTAVDLDLAAVWAPEPTPTPAPAPAEPETATTSGFSQRQWAYVAGGIGVAGLATFGIFGAMNNAKYSDLEDRCANNVCPSSASDDIDAGKRYQTIANIGLAVGVVGLGTGAALYFLAKDEPDKGREASKPATPEVGIGFGTVTVAGSF